MRFCRHPHPSRAFVGIPMRFCRHPHPARAFAGRLPMHFCRRPHPARAFAGRLPIHFYRRPPHRLRLRRDIHALLPAPPPRPRLRQGIPGYLAGRPHPARACGAPPPPPPGGGVRAWRYLVGSRIRGVTGRPPCPGGAGEQPCPVLPQDLPMQWTVWISPRGERLTGRGNLFPLPCLPHSNHLTSRRHPARAFADSPHTLLPAPPPHPRLRRSSPTPSWGGVRARAYTW